MGHQANLGWVYVLTNASFKENMIKIGFTNKPTPQERARELSKHTGVPTEFEVVYAVKVADAHAVETRVHHVLQHKRARQNREFFECTVAEAVRTIQSIVGRSAISEMDLRGRKKAPIPTAATSRSHQPSSSHPSKTVTTKQGGVKWKGWFWCVMVLVGGLMVIRYGVGEGSQASRTSASSQSVQATLSSPSSPQLAWQTSRQELQLAWDKIDADIQKDLHDEQQKWERKKMAQCAKQKASAGEAAQLSCEIKWNTERIDYLRGFSIR